MHALLAGTLALALTSPARGTPERDVYVFELRGLPVGWVELEREGSRYTYRSTHLFARGGDRARRQRSRTFELDARGQIAGSREQPSSLWLWRRPPPGCVPGRDELGERTGWLCVEAEEGDRSRGVALGEPFRATYADGVLASLEVGVARHRRLGDGERLPRFDQVANPFEEGLRIGGARGALTLDPVAPSAGESVAPGPWSADDARALARAVNRSFVYQEPSANDLAPVDDPGAPVGSCLSHARRFLRLAREAGREAELVVGLLAEDGRAYAHAWVRVATPGGPLEVDPTTLLDVSPRTHLALGDEARAGRSLLDLFSGKRRVVRR